MIEKVYRLTECSQLSFRCGRSPEPFRAPPSMMSADFDGFDAEMFFRPPDSPFAESFEFGKPENFTCGHWFAQSKFEPSPGGFGSELHLGSWHWSGVCEKSTPYP